VPGCWGRSRARTAASVSAWIGAQTRQWRAEVQVVAIDMCTVFKAAVRDSLPHVSGGRRSSP
jgi:transposase